MHMVAAVKLCKNKTSSATHNGFFFACCFGPFQSANSTDNTVFTSDSVDTQKKDMLVFWFGHEVDEG